MLQEVRNDGLDCTGLQFAVGVKAYDVFLFLLAFVLLILIFFVTLARIPFILLFPLVLLLLDLLRVHVRAADIRPPCTQCLCRKSMSVQMSTRRENRRFSVGGIFCFPRRGEKELALQMLRRSCALQPPFVGGCLSQHGNITYRYYCVVAKRGMNSQFSRLVH